MPFPLIAALGMSAAGKGIGAMSQSAANNRGQRLQAQMDQDRMRLAVQEENRTQERDILKKLAQADYLRSGGAQFQASGPYSASFAPRPTSDAQREAGRYMEQELMRRLSQPFQLQDYSKNMKPSGREKAGNILGPLLSMGGAATMPMTGGAAPMDAGNINMGSLSDYFTRQGASTPILR